ncbi:MAG: hypothetical protein JXR63_10540 [Spirochaetales bacterium]|nr:hypothetical protein [Spirochaetales bacterium]
MKKPTFLLFLLFAIFSCDGPKPPEQPTTDNGKQDPEKPNYTHLRMFCTENRIGANMGGRTGADKIISQTASEKELNIENIHAFLSAGNDDSVKMMPEKYDFPNDIPIYDETGTVRIADNWNDLLDGEIVTPLYCAGISPVQNAEWWSGTNSDGTTGENFKNFNIELPPNSMAKVIRGKMNTNKVEWLTGNPGYSSNGSKAFLLGIGCSKEPFKEYIPVESLTIEKSFHMTQHENVKYEIIIEPENASIQKVIMEQTGDSAWISHENKSIYGYEPGKVTCTFSLIQKDNTITKTSEIFIGAKKLVIFRTNNKYFNYELGMNLHKTLTNDASIDLTKYTNYTIFTSLSDLEIKDFPEIFYNHGFRNDIRIEGPTGKIIASNWSDLLDGEIRRSLADADVLPASSQWWSGSRFDGSLLKNGNNWSEESLSTYGESDIKDSRWITSGDNILAQYYFLGIAW